MEYRLAEGNVAIPQFPPELGYNPASEFWTAGLRTLILMPSDPSVRTISSTQYYLYNIVKQNFGKEVFVDFCFEPLRNVRSYYYKNFNYIMGSISHHDWRDFDIILCSLAITSTEFAELYKILYYSDMPMYHKDRYDDGVSPLLVAGGIAYDNSTSLDKIIDLGSHGLGERMLPRLHQVCLDVQLATHGQMKKHKSDIIKRICVEEKYRGFIYPSAYDYDWTNVKGHIEHNLKGVMEGFPTTTYPDLNLPIDKYGTYGDVQWDWPQPTDANKTQIQTSWGCQGAINSCTFCHESSLYGPWRERKHDDLLHGLEVAKRSGMGSAFTFYSFNANFLSYFPQSLIDAYDYFDHLSVLTFRTDAIAAQPDYLDLVKAVGAIGISAAVEGLGERIRNVFLKKHLTFQDWAKVADRVFKLRFIRYKMGFIWTGYEKKEDWDEGFGEIFHIMDLRDKNNSNAQLQLSFTKLVHNHGTPLYELPRYMSYDSWLECFDPNYYNYPFFPLIDRGLKVRICSNVGSTFVQQTVQDMGRLAEDVILKPSLENDVGSKQYLLAVKDQFAKYDIDPRAQFLELNPDKSPYQHMQVSYGEKFYKDIKNYMAKEGTPCLRTPSTVYHGYENKCKGCGQCPDIDKERIAEGLKVEVPMMKQLTERPLFMDAKLDEIKTRKLISQPSAYYTMVFKVAEEGRYVNKNALVRRWLSKVCDFIPGFAKNYRKFDYSTFSYLDYPLFASSYAGLDVVTAGFREKLPDDFVETIKKVNELCPTIKCIHYHPELVFGKAKYKALFRYEFNASLEDVQKMVTVLKENPFRIYSNRGDYEEADFPFDYKITQKNGKTYLWVLVVPRVNPFFSFLKKFNYVKLSGMCKQDIITYFTTDGSALYDVCTSKQFFPQGFIHVEKATVDREDVNEDAVEAEDG